MPESDGCCYASAPHGVFRDGQVLFSRQIGRVAMTCNRRTRFPNLPRTLVLAALLVGVFPSERAFAIEAQWIWTPAHTQGDVPQGACYFRKEIESVSPEEATLAIAADDVYELYLNGRLLGRSQSDQNRLTEYDISKALTNGRNLVAVKVVNREGGTAAVALRIVVRERGESLRYFSTDRSWKTNVRPLPLWNTVMYNDGRWTWRRSWESTAVLRPGTRPLLSRNRNNRRSDFAWQRDSRLSKF